MRWVALLICLVCVADARADDWGVKRNPFDPVVIRQYKALLVRDPHDRVLARLIALYKAYRTVAQLETEYRAQLESKPNDWSTLVVLARLPRSDRAATVALWTKALEANSKDSRGWLALGDATLDGAAARAAFKKAVEFAPAPREKRAALQKLIGAARSANDHATIDAAYGDLIALSPKDGQLWLDRGNAQLAAGKPAPAIESFGQAEKLLARDPERRLQAAMNRGVALERLGKVDEAIALWEQTLDKAPRGYYIRRDLVVRIVDAERKRKRLFAAIELLEKRWPEARRQYYEWDLLGDLHVENHDDEKALAAYRKAVAKAATEIGTQRKLIRMLDKLRPQEALGQHEAAARLAPGDANIQIELAKRYHDGNDHVKALAVLAKLQKRLANNVGTRIALAELYTQWDERALAIVEYEAVAKLEPKEPDHHITLGDAYWRAGYRLKAIAAWEQLTHIKNLATQLRQGDIFALHSLWTDAAAAYTRALGLDPTNADAWRGRARAYDELGDHADAVHDARRAVALIGRANIDDGFRVRSTLVRALTRLHASGRDYKEMTRTLKKWQFAFERGDVAAGYLLLAHHDRVRGGERHDLLVALYQRVPTDDALGIAVARSYSLKKDFARARAELEKIAARNPKRAKDIAYLIEQVETDKQRAAEERFREEEGITGNSKPRKVIGHKSRAGVRVGVGSDVYGTSSALLGVGFYGGGRFRRWRNTSFTLRFDWMQRDDDIEEINNFGLAYGLLRRVLSTRRLEVGIGVAPRVELRYGIHDKMTTPYRRAGLAGDLTIEVVPKALPAAITVRYQQAFTDDVRGSSLLFELGFEVR